MTEENANRYYVVSSEYGISKFDTDNDSMISIAVSKNQSEWVQFTYEDALIVVRETGYKMTEIEN